MGLTIQCPLHHNQQVPVALLACFFASPGAKEVDTGDSHTQVPARLSGCLLDY